ncbi:hypothetical protein FQA39_LY13120 [Lamprigera yunnana]|nr:hypothetical protein FQA39_LY13120 [Lamprigera yunnana]
MKVYILISVVISIQYINALFIDNFNVIIGNYEKYIEDLCAEESKVSPQLAKALISEGTLVDNKELKKFLFCIYLKAGITDKDGNVHEDIIAFYLGTGDPKIDEALYKRCASLTDDNATEKTWKIFKCRQNILKLYNM